MPILRPDEVLRYLAAKGFFSATEAERIASRWNAERDGPLLQFISRENILPPEVVEDLAALIGDHKLEGLDPRLPGLMLLREIGRGGRGTVFRAWQASLKRVVAVKVLTRQLGDNQEYIQRFLREARLASKARHRNIVRAFDINRQGEHTYMVMEYVPGLSLGQVLRNKGKLQPAEALEIGRAVADAIGYAARVGLVHRDVKPDNIMLDTRGRVKLCDLGLARPIGGDGLTGPMVAHGTPAYMAPEAALRPDIDAQADVYALGVTLYRTLLGKLPFENGDAVEVLRMHVEEQPRGLDGGELPGAISELIRRMLEKDPARRPNATELATEIGDLQRSLPGMDKPALHKLVPGGKPGRTERTAEAVPVAAGPAPAARPLPPTRPPSSQRRLTGIGMGTLGFALFVCIVYILVMALSGPSQLPTDPRLPLLEARVKELEADLATAQSERRALSLQLREAAERLIAEEAEDARRRASEPDRQSASEVMQEIPAMRETGRLAAED